MFPILLHGTFDKSDPHNTEALQEPVMVCNLSNQKDGAGESGI